MRAVEQRHRAKAGRPFPCKPERLGWIPKRGRLLKLLPAGQPRLPNLLAPTPTVERPACDPVAITLRILYLNVTVRLPFDQSTHGRTPST